MSQVAPSVDGRVQRGERSRARIVEAILALLREGEAAPTAEMVARRAGVGTRTLFRHFTDMEDLRGAVSERVGSEVLPILRGARFAGDLPERVRELVRVRTDAFEVIAPFRRYESADESSSATVREGRATLDALLRRQLQKALSAELDEAGPDALDALDALLSWQCWNRLRATRRLSRGRVTSLLENTTLALLAGFERKRT